MTQATPEALALLAWYRANGIDETIDDTPRPWFGTAHALESPGPEGASRSRHLAGETVEHSTATPAPQANLAAAPANRPSPGHAIVSATTLDELQAQIAAFEGCGLKKTARRMCFYRGSPLASVMVIGEAPGREEDLQGVPFVGPAGQLLDRMLGAIGLTEADVFITNLVFWKPPGNRTPSLEEVQSCKPFVDRTIQLVAPRLIVCLGGAAAKEMTGVAEGITKLRGKWLPYAGEAQVDGPGPKVMAIFHPAYLLRNPIAKRLAWRDLLSIREELGGDAR
jgi:DNA polymerase